MKDKYEVVVGGGTAGVIAALQSAREGVVPTIPHGALLPKNSKNILVAG